MRKPEEGRMGRWGDRLRLIRSAELANEKYTLALTPGFAS